jgi:hypothetical protein
LTLVIAHVIAGAIGVGATLDAFVLRIAELICATMEILLAFGAKIGLAAGDADLTGAAIAILEAFPAHAGSRITDLGTMSVVETADAGLISASAIAAGTIVVVLAAHALIGHGIAFLVAGAIAVVDATHALAVVTDGFIAIVGGQALDAVGDLRIADPGGAMAVVAAAHADVILRIAGRRVRSGADTVVQAFDTFQSIGMTDLPVAMSALNAVDAGGHLGA